MAVHIRLKRQGRRKRPFYRVVAIDSRTRRNGREIERLGWYDPIKEGLAIELKQDRVFHWLNQGAIPTDTVSSLLRRIGMSYKWHLMKSGMEDSKIEQEMEAWTARQLGKAEKASKKKAKKKASKAEAASVKEAEVEESSPEVAEAAPEVAEAASVEEAEVAEAKPVDVGETDTVVEEVEKASSEQKSED